jgi:hypothetical protein
MSDIEKIEMARYYGELEDDLNHLVRKYCRIMGWEVPELDEPEARRLILDAVHKALEKVEAE